LNPDSECTGVPSTLVVGIVNDAPVSREQITVATSANDDIVEHRWHATVARSVTAAPVTANEFFHATATNGVYD
jgi:hypothetical protein